MFVVCNNLPDKEHVVKYEDKMAQLSFGGLGEIGTIWVKYLQRSLNFFAR